MVESGASESPPPCRQCMATDASAVVSSSQPLAYQCPLETDVLLIVLEYGCTPFIEGSLCGVCCALVGWFAAAASSCSQFVNDACTFAMCLHGRTNTILNIT